MATKYEFYDSGDDQIIDVFGATWRAMTFTPSTAHAITRVKLLLFRTGSPGTVTVSIRATSSGLPTGSDLTSGTTDGDALTTSALGAWYFIDLTEYRLSASTEYGIVVRATSGDASNKLSWRRDSSSATYAGGGSSTSTDSGGNWAEEGGAKPDGTAVDYMFEEWGVTDPTITTQTCEDVVGATATGRGNITSLGATDPTAHGHCWNTSVNPTTSDDNVDNGGTSTTGAFTSAITGLIPGTAYYTRAYATNDTGTSYGANVYFIPPTTDPRGRAGYIWEEGSNLRNFDENAIEQSKLNKSDVDDTAVNGATDVPVSSNWAFDHVAAADPHTGYVLESLFDAQTVLHATSDDTPVALTVTEQTVVGRLTGANITAVALGIADNNIAQIDHASVADDDYAKFTTAGLEGRSYSEVASDIQSSIDHGSIQGLSDVADHAYALLHNGTRALSGAWSMGSQATTNVNIDSGTIGGITLDGAIAGGDQSFTGVGDMTFTSGSILKSGSTNTNTLLLAANDTTFITLTTGATDTMTLATFAMGGAAITGHAQGIADNAILTVDQVSPADDDYAKFTANGLEGRSYQELVNDISGVIKGTDVEVSELSAATYDDVQDYINFFGDRTLFSGGGITDNGDGTATVEEGTAWSKVSDSDTAVGRFFDFSEDATVSLTDLVTNHVYLDYNGGTPQIVVSTDVLTHGLKQDHILIGHIFRNGTTLHLHDEDYLGVGRMGRINMHHLEHDGVQRSSGIVTSGTGTRNLSVTTGVLYDGISRHTTVPFTTPNAGTADATEANTLHDADGDFASTDVGKTVHNTTDDTYTVVTAFVDSGQLTLDADIFISGEAYDLDIFSYWYATSSGTVWNEVKGSTAISNTQYNDITNGGLSSLTANRYGVHWVYMDMDGHDLHVVYGQGDYKANEAEEAGVPSVLPDLVVNYCVLIAKIIVQKDTDTLTITYPWTTVFTSSLATDHGSLGGLTDIADHPYAALIAGTRAFTGNQSMGGNAITGHAQAITDNAVMTVDGSPNSGEFARFTAAGLEGRTGSEVLGDIGALTAEQALAYALSS